MQDTVDQAHSACHAPSPTSSRTRSGPCVPLLRRQPSRVCSFSGTGPDGLPLARFARARLRGLIGEADMTAVLAPAGDVFTDVTVIYGSTR